MPEIITIAINQVKRQGAWSVNHNGDMKTLASRLSEARQNAGLTQADLAKLAGLKNQSIIGSLESGYRKTSSYIPAIAQALGVSALWLSDGRGPRHPGGEEPGEVEFIDLKKEAGDMAKRAMRIAYAWIKLPEEEQAKIWAELIEGGLPASSEGSRKAILDDAIPDADFRTQDPIQKSG